MAFFSKLKNARKNSEIQRLNASAPENNMEQALHFHAAVYEHITSGLISYNAEGIITFINKSASSILGYQDNELLSKSVSLFLDSKQTHFVLSDREFFNKEFWFVRKDGTKTAVTYYSDSLENSAGRILVFHEMAESFHNPENVDRMERLALLGEFSIGIAHELRNPLAGIKSIAQTLHEYSEKKNEIPAHEIQEFLKRLISGVDRANDILQGFFKFAQPAKARPDHVDVEMLISGVYLLLAPMMRQNDIRFESKFQERAIRVYVDVHQIEQALFNIVMNALEAMKFNRGGKVAISVRTELRQVANETGQLFEKELVLISISDTGMGIKPEHIEKIFNPFFTTKSDHVGLGLAISSRLVEENRGWIEVNSPEENGSVFTLLLPTL